MRKQQEHKLSIAELGNATQSQNFLARDVDEIMEDAWRDWHLKFKTWIFLKCDNFMQDP